MCTKNYIPSAATKEVLNYRETILLGFNLIIKHNILSNNIIKEIQSTLEKNNAGFRKIPGTPLKIREKKDNEKEWHDWILFILKGIEITAKDTIVLVKKTSDLMTEYKHQIINSLFSHPYTKIEFMEKTCRSNEKLHQNT